MTRTPVLLPPTGWRPPAIRESVKIDVVIRQVSGCGCEDCLRYPETQIRLRSSKLTRFDHRPPVHEREWLPHLEDTTPSANDPKFIRALDVDHDKPITSADVTRMRKVGRIRDAEAAHADYVDTKVPGQKRGRQSKHFGGRRAPTPDRP